MICLDTNYLILGLVDGSAESGQILGWIQTGETLVTSAACWYEFLSGPVSPTQIQTIRSVLDQVIGFGEAQAAAAAQIFHSTGRKRSLRVDVMIAATAQVAGAALATNKKKDFAVFQAHGVRLV